jgi:hypothetical protein
MNKSQLRQLIRESIREIMGGKQMLNEYVGCSFHWKTGECGPSYCSIQAGDYGGEYCLCRTWMPGSDYCDESDTGGSMGVSNNLGGISKGTGISGGTGVKKPTYQKYSMKEIDMDIEPILPSTDKKNEWCTCRRFRCKKEEGHAWTTWNYSECTGEGGCACLNGNKTALQNKKN